MKLIAVYTTLLLMLSTLLAAQNKKEELLKWSADRKLTWDDYKAKPNPASDAAATTTTHLAIEYNIKGGHFNYQITSMFSKTNSWGLHKTDYILSHEQGHFDIAEIYARKLHQRMSEYKFNRKTYSKDLKKIYNDIIEEKSEMQELYDKETNHSINRKKQAEWLLKIEEMLDETAEYEDY
jgi:hypothetical protein